LGWPKSESNINTAISSRTFITLVPDGFFTFNSYKVFFHHQMDLNVSSCVQILKTPFYSKEMSI
jgi:hypothetical protein